MGDYYSWIPMLRASYTRTNLSAVDRWPLASTMLCDLLDSSIEWASGTCLLESFNNKIPPSAPLVFLVGFGVISGYPDDFST